MPGQTQQSLYISYIIWLVIDFLFVETLATYTYFIFLPLSITKELKQTKNSIKNLMLQVLEIENTNQKDIFNLPRSYSDVSTYFYVSSRIKNFFQGFETNCIHLNKLSLLEMCEANENLNYLERFVICLASFSYYYQDIIYRVLWYLFTGGSFFVIFQIYSNISIFFALPIAIVFILIVFVFLLSHRLFISYKNSISVSVEDPLPPSEDSQEFITPGNEFNSKVYSSSYYVQLFDSFILRPEYYSIATTDELIIGKAYTDSAFDNPNITFDFSSITPEELLKALQTSNSENSVNEYNYPENSSDDINDLKNSNFSYNDAYDHIEDFSLFNPILPSENEYAINNNVEYREETNIEPSIRNTTYSNRSSLNIITDLENFDNPLDESYEFDFGNNFNHEGQLENISPYSTRSLNNIVIDIGPTPIPSPEAIERRESMPVNIDMDFREFDTEDEEFHEIDL